MPCHFFQWEGALSLRRMWPSRTLETRMMDFDAVLMTSGVR